MIPTRRTPEVAPQTPWVSDWALVGARRWRTPDANLLQTTLVPCTGGGVGCIGWIYPPLDLRCFSANIVEPQVELAIGTLHSAVCKTSKIGVRWWEHESHCEWDRVRVRWVIKTAVVPGDCFKGVMNSNLPGLLRMFLVTHINPWFSWILMGTWCQSVFHGMAHRAIVPGSRRCRFVASDVVCLAALQPVFLRGCPRESCPEVGAANVQICSCKYCCTMFYKCLWFIIIYI